jgi:chromosome segregation ATPase
MAEIHTGGDPPWEKPRMEDADTPRTERRALVLRVEIESIGEQLAHLLVKDAQEVPLPEDDERAAQIAAAEAQLEEQRARLQEEAERLDRLARDLADREAEAGGLTAAQRIRIAHSSWQAHETQRALHDQPDEIDAAHEADVFLREERLEQREAELALLEQQLRRKETELMVYVADLQEELVRRETSSGWDPIAAALGG